VEALERYLKAILLVHLEAMRTDGRSTAPAVLLQRAGFTLNEIAEMQGGKRDAVKSALRRAKRKNRVPRRGLTDGR
jgi:hypothetical protein